MMNFPPPFVSVFTIIIIKKVLGTVVVPIFAAQQMKENGGLWTILSFGNHAYRERMDHPF